MDLEIRFAFPSVEGWVKGVFVWCSDGDEGKGGGGEDKAGKSGGDWWSEDIVPMWC